MILSTLRARKDQLGQQVRTFARMTGRAGKMQHFRYGVAKVRGRWYYRYHKPIGRANWKGYQERYIPPKDVEAKQRLVFAPKPTTKQLRQSISWEWRLPKLLAQATTPNQVLDTWILFRYRQPKRTSHFMMTLKRLVELGGCEPTDWRLRVLLSHMRRGYKRVINPDIFLEYMSSLHLYREMERFTRFLKPRIQHMKPHKLVRVLNAFGSIHLRDPSVAGLVLRYLKRDFKSMSSADLISTVRNLGNMEIRNSPVYNQIGFELSKRELSLPELVDFLSASRQARVRDYTLIERATASALSAMNSGERNEMKQICRLCTELRLLGITDKGLLDKAFTEISPLKLPTSSLIEITRCGDVIAREKLQPFINEVISSICLLNKKSELLDAAVIIDSTFESVNHSASAIAKISEQLVAIRGKTCIYDVPRLADILNRRGIENAMVWLCIVNDIKAGLIDFEPEDLLKTAQLLHDVPADILGDNRGLLANEVASWSLKRWEEFTTDQWTRITELITRDAVTCSQWHRDELKKWTPNISLANSSSDVNAV